MLISFLITLVIVGVCLYLLNTLVPMSPKIKTVINVVVLVMVFFYVLSAFGVIPASSFPHLR
jgi:hypothetical protein